MTNKSGYVGQLYEVVGFTVSASPATVNKGGTRQLNPASVLDDTSLLALPPNSPSWSVESGPISAISSDGVVTAAIVYRNEPALVRANLSLATAVFSLLVLNTTNPDSFGTYAGDDIDDAWQVQYFGLSHSALAIHLPAVFGAAPCTSCGP